MLAAPCLCGNQSGLHDFLCLRQAQLTRNQAGEQRVAKGCEGLGCFMVGGNRLLKYPLPSLLG